MHPIEVPDKHYLAAAVGWLELGNTREALGELAQLSPALAGHPHVLEVRWMIAASERNWPAALEVAEQLVEIEPASPSAWLHRAYALRRVPGGGLEAAWDALLPAAGKFPREPTIPYNLACYACQLERVDEGRGWLERARRIGDKKRIKQMALADEDLKPLWAEVGGWR